MKIDRVKVMNFDNAIHGMRNPLESYHRSDSYTFDFINDGKEGFVLGENDADLAKRLIKAGDSDRKFLRQIFVSVDLTAPLYLWKEIDQYKVATTTNSTSTMHKLATTPITLECFEVDDYNCELDGGYGLRDTENFFYTEREVNCLIDFLEGLRKRHLETKDKRYWKELIRWLPESWLQTRTWTLNYETLRNIYFSRKNHKLSEWHTICNWIETLPYADILITYK